MGHAGGDDFVITTTTRAAPLIRQRIKERFAAEIPAHYNFQDRVPVDAAAGPVYAVVARASRQREAAARDLALMQAAGSRLPPPAPGHAELMQTHGEWRAAWWPCSTRGQAPWGPSWSGSTRCRSASSSTG